MIPSRRHPPSWWMATDDFVPPLVEPLLLVSDRLATLNLSDIFLGLGLLPKIPNLPILSSLSLSCPSETAETFSIPSGNLNSLILAAPQLRNLVAHGPLKYPWDSIETPWEQLSTLAMSSMDFWHQVPANSLTNLTKLILSHSTFYLAPQFTTSFNLPSLTTLVIHDFDILKWLETPRLTSFTTIRDLTLNDDCHCLEPFFISSTRLRNMTLNISPNPCDVMQYLHLVPELQSLDLRAPLIGAAFYYGVPADLPDTKRYLDESTKFFHSMTFNLDTLDNSAQIPLPKLKYLTLNCPRLFRKQFLGMIQSRCDPPHQLLRLELWLDEPPKTISQEELTSLTDDWEEMQDELLQLMKDGKMDVRIYTSG